MLLEKEIINKLKRKNLSKYPDPIELLPLAQALWVLAVVKDNVGIKRIKAKSISYILSELKELDLKEKAIINAFARAKNRVKCYKEKDGVYYEIMAPGRRELELKQKKRDMTKTIIFITGEKPWTDRNEKFMALISSLTGEVSILDPYYGIDSFHILSKFSKNNVIKFLTSQLGKDEDKIKIEKELARFKKEFKNIEIAIYPKFYELHDRYIISDNYFIIVGHGLKDIGDKECFLIALPTKEVADLIKIVKEKFKERWKKSQKLT